MSIFMGEVLTGLNGLSETKQNKIESMKLGGAYVAGYRGSWTGKPAGSYQFHCRKYQRIRIKEKAGYTGNEIFLSTY